MNAKDMKNLLDEGKTVYRDCGVPGVNISMLKHPSGTYVLMDVAHGIFVTTDYLDVATNTEIIGWREGIPVLTIKTEEWFA